MRNRNEIDTKKNGEKEKEMKKKRKKERKTKKSDFELPTKKKGSWTKAKQRLNKG